MEMIKTALMTACITALISSAVMMAAPAKRKGELRLICTLVLICSIASVIAGTDIPVPDIDSTHTLQFDYQEMLLTQSRTAIEYQISEKLAESGHPPSLVCIEADFDQYNYIITTRADIYIPDLQPQESEEILSAVREVTGDDCEVNIYDAGA